MEKLRNEYYNLFFSPNVIRVMGWTGHVARIGQMRTKF